MIPSNPSNTESIHMTEAEVLTHLAEQTGDSPAHVRNFLALINDLITKKLDQGEEVPIPKLGKFEVSQRAARTGRNPRTGETLTIPAKNTVRFKPHKSLRDAV